MGINHQTNLFILTFFISFFHKYKVSVQTYLHSIREKEMYIAKGIKQSVTANSQMYIASMQYENTVAY